MDNPKTFEEALDVELTTIKKTLLSKQHDYGKSNILDFGIFGVLVRVNDKLARLKNLYNKDNPKCESLQDSWLDLSGYGVLALMIEHNTFELPYEETDENQGISTKSARNGC